MTGALTGVNSLPSFQLRDHPLSLFVRQKVCQESHSPNTTTSWAFQCNQFEWQCWILDKIVRSKVWRNICFNFSRDHWGITVVWCEICSENTDSGNVQTFTSERESSPWGRILRNHQIGKRNVDLEGSKIKRGRSFLWNILFNNIASFNIYLYLQSTML